MVNGIGLNLNGRVKLKQAEQIVTLRSTRGRAASEIEVICPGVAVVRAKLPAFSQLFIVVRPFHNRSSVSDSPISFPMRAFTRAVSNQFVSWVRSSPWM